MAPVSATLLDFIVSLGPTAAKPGPSPASSTKSVFVDSHVGGQGFWQLTTGCAREATGASVCGCELGLPTGSRSRPDAVCERVPSVGVSPGKVGKATLAKSRAAEGQHARESGFSSPH